MTGYSWARDAVIYQIYLRSFADSDGDGLGDLPGVLTRLDYLADLGVDAVWLTPFFPSPMVDGGYDVADYRGVDPRLGTLTDLDRLLVQARRRGLRVIIDLVANHCSDRHPWFQAARAARPGSPQRRWFWFRRGRGADGGLPPNDWQSIFGGPAWTRLPDGEWYLHLFAPEQPDLNWNHPGVRAEFAAILRFWLDRGVDGVRVDVAHGMVKADGLPDAAHAPPGADPPYFDQDGVHDIYREWRSIMDEYHPPRVAVAEVWLADLRRIARYVRPDELHQAFNFGFLLAGWSGPDYRRVIDESLAAMGEVGAPTTWVLSNHDVVRHASRLAAEPAGTGSTVAGDAAGASTAGLRRARAATLAMLALPGSAYLYQGEELGLPQVFDLPDAARQDPVFWRSHGARPGRDGCRVPLPWSGTAPPYGFGPPGSSPWLPQPPSWAELTVQAQRAEVSSTLSLYRQALRLRRQLPALGDGVLRWHSAPGDDLLVFERPARNGGAAVVCALNQGARCTQLPGPVRGRVPLVASGPSPAHERCRPELPPDTAAWWAVD